MNIKKEMLSVGVKLPKYTSKVQESKKQTTQQLGGCLIKGRKFGRDQSKERWTTPGQRPKQVAIAHEAHRAIGGDLFEKTNPQPEKLQCRLAGKTCSLG